MGIAAPLCALVVAYTKEIGFNSVCAMISPQPDRHDEHWLNASLFVLF